MNVLWVFTSFVQPPCESCVTFDQLCRVYWSWNTSRYVAIRQKKHRFFPTEIWQGLHAVTIHHPDFFVSFSFGFSCLTMCKQVPKQERPQFCIFRSVRIVWDTPVYARIAHTQMIYLWYIFTYIHLRITLYIYTTWDASPPISSHVFMIQSQITSRMMTPKERRFFVCWTYAKNVSRCTYMYAYCIQPIPG